MNFNIKKTIVYMLFIILIVLVIFLLYNKNLNNLDKKAIELSKEYINNSNIMVNKSLYIGLEKINSGNDFNNCYNGSGVLVINEDGILKYNAYLKCDNYETKVNNKNKYISLKGSDIIIINNNEEFIDPGYDTNSSVSMLKKEYENVKIISYYVTENNEIKVNIDRIVINTNDKEKNIDGNVNNAYPSIALIGESEINTLYNDDYIDKLYTATDYSDGDITNKVMVDNNVDTKKIGKYSINYYVFNSKGNYSSVKRIVNVISDKIDFTYETRLSEEKRTDKLDIIITIKGDGYSHIVLPDGNESKEKEISYSIDKNDNYKFIIFDVNNKSQEIIVPVNNIVNHNKVKTSYSINYPLASTNMTKVTSDELLNYFISKGYTSNNGIYKVTIDNETYSYDISSNKLNYSGDFVYCEFYKTVNSKLGLLDNTITLLAGSGERTYGPISNNKIPSNINFNDYSLLITLKKDSSYNMSKHPKMISACTKLGMMLSGGNTINSIIGYSEGAQAAARTVSYNKVKYNTIVFVNGSAYYTKDVANLISNYEPFKDMEIIMFECKNNNNWNETIIKTINDLLRNGVNNNQINLYTNDNTLINTFTNIIPLIVVNYDWNGHGSGYQIIRESNILSYLSSK